MLQVSELQEEPLLKCDWEQQRQDKELNDLMNYLQNKELTMNEQSARKVLKMGFWLLMEYYTMKEIDKVDAV